MGTLAVGNGEFAFNLDVTGLQSFPEVEQNLNPGMELGYWRWALETALTWRIRLGLPVDPLWQKVAQGLAPPPIRNGVFVTLETPETS